MAQGAESFSGVSYCGSLYANGSFQDISGHWAQPSIYRVVALGVIRGEGSRFRPDAAASKEDVLGMLIRLANQEEAAQRMVTDPRDESAHANPWGANYVALAQAMGIITDEERRKTNWQAAATREETAYWMARALGLMPVYGPAQQAIYGFSDWKEFTKSRIPYCEAVIGSRIMTGRTASSFSPRQAIKRGELAAVLDKASQVYLIPKGYRILQGTIANSTFASTSPGMMRNTYQVVQDDGQSFFMTADSDRDFLVYKNGNLSKSGLLSNGDHVRVMAGPLNQILLVEATSGLQSVLDGILDYLDVSGNRLYLTAWDGKNYILALSPLCKVSLSGYPARMNDLVPGQQVSLFLNGQQVSEIRGAVTYASSGALPREASSVYGTLYRKSYDELSIRDSNGRAFTYTIDSNTGYYVNGLAASYYDLRTGDSVKLTLDSSRKVRRVDVTRDDGAYKIYRARMYSINDVFGEIRFDEIYRYVNGTFTADVAGMALSAADDLEAYEGNKKLSLLELEKYRGRYAYFVTARRGDQERVIRLIVREDTERMVSGKVQETNALLNSLTVKYEPDRIYYDSGTIVIRDGRLIDGDSINTGDDLVLFAESESDNSIRARLIVISSPEGESRYGLYKGYLKSLTSRSRFEIGSSSKMENNRWRGDSGYTQFYYDSETRFLYASTGSAERITDSQFYNRDEDYLDQDVYVIADGDKALAVIILDGIQFSSEIATRGTIDSVDTDEMLISNITSWSQTRESWETQSGELSLKLRYAVAAKNGKGRDPAALQPGDPVYLLRASVAGAGSDVYASLILVE